jgi:AP-1 complex subunit gamma-1
VLVQAGAYVRDDACRALLLLVVNASQLHGYAVRAAWRALAGHLDAAQPSLLMVATWCIGEYGELLVGPEAGKLLEGEQALGLGEADVVGLLEAVLQLPQSTLAVREYALTALAKLAARLPASAERIKGVVGAHRQSAALEVQTRSVEYSRLFAYPAIEPQVTAGGWEWGAGGTAGRSWAGVSTKKGGGRWEVGAQLWAAPCPAAE